MRDFEWADKLWVVINDDGTYAGVPCLTYEEACDLASFHDGAKIFKVKLEG